ncbi:hypothetical protein MIR68_006308 [Amoeboaphelidium protococcarum]|nr:hypothetical protein MIR68_006308 [Amoeboaphelidium protococcarum]
MPKNKGKGGKTRRRGKNEATVFKRELIYKDEDQVYASVSRMLGNGRLEAMCFDGQKRLAHIRGKMQKKVWINAGDIVLLSLREWQDGKADVIHKYNPDEAKQLKAEGELPESAIINEDAEEGGPGGMEGEDVVFQQSVDQGVGGSTMQSNGNRMLPSSDEESDDGQLNIDDI